MQDNAEASSTFRKKKMRNLSLSKKVYLVLGFMITIAIGIGVMGIVELSDFKKKLDYANDKTLPRLSNALTTQSNFRRLTIGQYRLAASDNQADKLKIVEDMKNYKKELEEDFARGLAQSSEARLADWKQAEKNYTDWMKLSEEIQQYSLEEKDHEATEISKKQRPFRLEAEKIFDTLVTANKESSRLDQADAEAEYYNVRMILICTIVIGVVLSSLLAWLIMRSLISSLNNTVEVIQQSTNQVAAASSQIASAAQELSEASIEQASSLEETASSLEEISTMVAKSTENADSASSMSGESSKKAELGRQAVDQMLTSMDDISQSNDAILNQVNESNRQMAEIVKVIQEIGQKTKVINEIVFQTKLLSFNASVEAARAGEHGKGFAVVAEEVGNLAQMSGNAAKDITDMLDASISKVEVIVKNTQEQVEVLVKNGKQKVDSGVDVAKQCSDLLIEIVQNVSRVSEYSHDIAKASKEQSVGVSEINKAMSQLDAVTQKNTATSEEAASAAEELAAQSESLKASVEDLIVVIHGVNSDSGITPSYKNTDHIVSSKKVKSNVVQLKSKTVAVSKFGNAAVGGNVPDRNGQGFKEY